jgi:hypothetical protein
MLSKLSSETKKKKKRKKKEKKEKATDEVILGLQKTASQSAMSRIQKELKAN